MITDGFAKWYFLQQGPYFFLEYRSILVERKMEGSSFAFKIFVELAFAGVKQFVVVFTGW